MKKYAILIIALLTTNTFAASPAEIAASHHLAASLDNPEQLNEFLRLMPKGGDLHNHASGSTFAEKMVEYAANDNLCVDRTNFLVTANAQCPANDLLSTAIQDADFFDSLVDAWSMQHFKPGNESGHDHFFKTFTKFSAISHHHLGEILAEITNRAADQNELYVETMITADNGDSGKLGKKLGWDPDFNSMRAKLLANHFDDIVAGITTNINQAEAAKNKALACGTADAKSGCNVTLRYQHQVAREQPPEVVFAEMLAGFEGASKDKRLVAVNMVMPEDGTVSMRDYKLHMQMMEYLHGLYPNVHISLHAGELNSDVATPQGLSFHINDAVNVAHANRIGHGVDIINETNYPQLLKTMADKQIMVEINLSSNAEILNIEGKNHPLPLYMQYGVPVALSTDDEGVTRDIMTTEYVRAVSTYKFKYLTLKNMVRNSISYGFLPGENLWQDKDYHQLNSACLGNQPGSSQPSASCKAFLVSSEKATLQWKLEQRFIEFENRYRS